MLGVIYINPNVRLGGEGAKEKGREGGERKREQSARQARGSNPGPFA